MKDERSQTIHISIRPAIIGPSARKNPSSAPSPLDSGVSHMKSRSRKGMMLVKSFQLVKYARRCRLIPNMISLMQTFEVKTGWLARLVSPLGEDFGVVGTRGDRDQRLQPTHVTAVRKMRRRMRNRAVVG